MRMGEFIRNAETLGTHASADGRLVESDRIFQNNYNPGTIVVKIENARKRCITIRRLWIEVMPALSKLTRRVAMESDGEHDVSSRCDALAAPCS